MKERCRRGVCPVVSHCVCPVVCAPKIEFGHHGSIFEIRTQQQAFRSQAPPPSPARGYQTGGASSKTSKGAKAYRTQERSALSTPPRRGVGQQDPRCLQLFFQGKQHANSLLYGFLTERHKSVPGVQHSQVTHVYMVIFVRF